jgi:hypothetical protein
MCAIIFSVNFINASTEQNTTLRLHHWSSVAEKLLFFETWKIQNTTRLFGLQSYSVTHPSTSHSSTATQQMALPFIQPFPLPFYTFIESLRGVSNEIIVQ